MCYRNTKPRPERLQEKRFAYGINVSGLKLAINLADQREANDLPPSLPTQSVVVSPTFKGFLEKLIVTHLVSKFIGETWLISLTWGGQNRPCLYSVYRKTQVFHFSVFTPPK